MFSPPVHGNLHVPWHVPLLDFVGNISLSYFSVTAPAPISRRILVVDDEPMVCDSIRRVLAADKHQVQTAACGQEALALFQSGAFDLVILDYEMPDMKGDKLAAAIKALVPTQPILMITAYTESLRHTGSFPLAVDRVLGKPFDVQELRAAARLTALRPRAES